MAYEALYRRYRPSKFADVAGQSHVVAALRNAVEGDRVGHAYLFSGPRGTGKTSSARILAKALNCTDLRGGEPCDECESCRSFLAGGSYDLHELDAASNNGVDAMRDLIAKVALGSPGRTKVYILDEVHMLTGGAENALLKTLEEPPPHVVFVLCTTEPNKVVPTIRSRTQHLEFSLLTADDIGALVDEVIADAGLEVTDDDRAYVIRSGGGSARDTLSALDQVVAAGGAPQGVEHLDALFQALIDRDGAAALAALDGALQAGRDPAGIAAALLDDLRGVFLAVMRADVSHLPESQRARAEQRASAMAPARITRAIEVIGASAIDMRQAPDPRVDLEVALMRLTRHDLDVSVEALLERIEALEAGAAPSDQAGPASIPIDEVIEPAAPAGDPSSPPAPAAPPTPSSPDPPASQEPSSPPAAPDPGDAAASVGKSAPDPGDAAASVGKSGADIARAALAQHQPEGEPSVPMAVEAARADLTGAPKLSRTLADVRREKLDAAEAAASAPEVDPSPSAPAEPDPATASDAAPPSPTPPAGDTGGRREVALTDLEQAWSGGVLESLSGRARSRFSAGRFFAAGDGRPVFGLPNPVHRDRCAEIRDEFDQALAAHFGGPVEVELVVDTAEPESSLFDGPPSDAPPPLGDDEVIDPDELIDAGGSAPSATDRVLATFEGSRVVDDPPSPAADGR